MWCRLSNSYFLVPSSPSLVSVLTSFSLRFPCRLPSSSISFLHTWQRFRALDSCCLSALLGRLIADHFLSRHLFPLSSFSHQLIVFPAFSCFPAFWQRFREFVCCYDLRFSFVMTASDLLNYGSKCFSVEWTIRFFVVGLDLPVLMVA